MLGFDYLSNVDRALDELRGRSSNLRDAAKLIVDSAQSKGRLFVHDPTGIIAYEASGRAAGLFMVKSLGPGDLSRSRLTREDVVLYFSGEVSSEEGQKVFLDKVKGSGARIIGILPAGDGKKSDERLIGYFDLVIDSCVQGSSGTVEVPGFDERLGSLDLIVNCVIVWAICAEVVGEFLRRGLTPSVYVSMRANGSKEYNSRVWDRFQRQGF